MTMENPNTNFSGTEKNWEEIAMESSARKAREEKAALEQLIIEAAANGKEEFNVEKLLNYYYPNDLTSDEEMIRRGVELYRSDYYHSSAMTLEDWAKNKEQIEAQGDS